MHKMGGAAFAWRGEERQVLKALKGTGNSVNCAEIENARKVPEVHAT